MGDVVIDTIIGIPSEDLRLLLKRWASVVGENGVLVGRCWWRMDMLLLSTARLAKAQKDGRETWSHQRAAANLAEQQTCKVYAPLPLFFFFSTIKTTNSNHRLCRPTFESTPWRWRLRWTGRERHTTFKTVVARVVSSETAPMIR
jgi:hypothetical protein